MPWQLMNEGELRGPLSEEEFLAVLPTLGEEAKLYKDGWKEWRRLGDVPASELPKPPEPELPAQDESASRPAGFWRRAGALIVDTVLVQGIFGFHGLSVISASMVNGQWSWNGGEGLGGWLNWSFLVTLAYEGLMIHKFGWTLGKFIFGARVSHEGRLPTLQRSLLRVLAKKLNVFTLFLGYLMAAWNKDKKALHDHLCSTRVFLRG
jgi:uncharacterized RDD family membrane protein YckC